MSHDTKLDPMDRLERLWVISGSTVIAALFWIIIGVMVLCTAAMGSMDLFVKAMTGATTAGVALAVFKATRAFQAASVENERKKLRLQMLDKRLPFWSSFITTNSDIEEVGRKTEAQVKTLRRLHRESSILFANRHLPKTLLIYTSHVETLATPDDKGVTADIRAAKAVPHIVAISHTIVDMMRDEMSVADI